MTEIPAQMVLLQNPEHAVPRRTTIDVTAPFVAVFALVHHAWQETHEHYFEEITRFGDAVCHGCGLTAWSESWVAEGVFGDATHAWAAERYVEHLMRLRRPEPTIAVVAALDESEPAQNAHLEDAYLHQSAYQRALASQRAREARL